MLPFRNRLIFFLIILKPAFAQFNEHDFSLSANLVYTTSAEIFLNPNSSDLIVRNQSNTVEDIFNPSVDLRYRIFDEVILGLNIEWMNKTAKGELLNLDSNGITLIEVDEGFMIIPVELTVHYYFPFSTDQFKFLMGGGIGYYRGEYIREFSNVDLEAVERKIALGIHVSTSMDYMVLDNLSFRFEMKFRDPQFEVRSRYSKTVIMYQGKEITLPDGSFETKVNVDGLTFLLGIVYHL